MKRKEQIVFIGCLTSFVISMKLFLNINVFHGGNLWIYLNWLRMFILFVMTVILGIHLFHQYKS